MHPPTSSTYPAGRSLPPSSADPRSFPAAGDIAVSGPGFAQLLRSSPPSRVADAGPGSNSKPRAELERAPWLERERRAELVNDGPPAPARQRPATPAAPRRAEEVAGDDLSAPPAAEEAEPAEPPLSDLPLPADPGDTSDTAATASEETDDTALSMLLAVVDVPLTVTAERAAAITTDELASDAPVSVSASVASTITSADGGGEVMSPTAVPLPTEAAEPPAARVSMHAEPFSSTPLAPSASEIIQVEAVVPPAVTSDPATSAQPEKTAVTVADGSTVRQLSGVSATPQQSEPSVDTAAAGSDTDTATTVVAGAGTGPDVGYGNAENAGDNPGERFAGGGPGQAAATAGHAGATGRFEIPRNDAEAPRSPTAQLAVPVARAAKAGVQRVEIALEPAALGRVDVRLDFTPDGRVSAFFVAENRQALDALRADAQTLARALSDAGVDTGGLGFGLRHREPGSDGGSFASTFGRSGGEPGAGRTASTEVVGDPQSLFRSGSLGRLDIRA